MTVERECRCTLAARQAKVDNDFAAKGQVAPRLWHSVNCPIAMMVELRNLEAKIAEVESKMPLPGFEALDADAREVLTNRRTQLRSRLHITDKPDRAQPRTGARP